MSTMTPTPHFSSHVQESFDARPDRPVGVGGGMPDTGNGGQTGGGGTPPPPSPC